MTQPAQPLTAKQEAVLRKGDGEYHPGWHPKIWATLDAERAAAKALREALDLIAHGKGDGISGFKPAAECRRIAEAALAGSKP